MNARDSTWLTCKTNRTKINTDVKLFAELLDDYFVILFRPAATDLVYLDDAAFESLQLPPRLTPSGIIVSSFDSPLLNHEYFSNVMICSM